MQLAVPAIMRSRTLSGPWLGFALRTVLAVAATGCAFLAQHAGDQAQVPAWVVAATLVAIAGALLAMPAPQLRMPTAITASRNDTRALAPGVALLGLPTLVAAFIWSSEPYDAMRVFIHPASTFAALLWLAGAATGLIALAAVGREDRPSPGAGAWWQRRSLPILEVVACIAIVDVAIGLRVWHLGALPQGVWLDEVDTQVGAVRQLTSPFQPLGIGNFDHNPSLYFYAMAVLIKVFGDTITVLRMTSVIFGILAVIAVYLIGRRVGGTALGLSAAALLAIGDWAIDFSRIAMPNMAAPAMISAALIPFAIAMYRPRAFWFALCGVMLGFALMSYEGAYLPAAVAAFVAGFRMLIDRDYRHAAWPSVALLPFGFLIGAAPWFVALKLSPGFTMARINTVSLMTEYHAWPDRINAFESNLRKHLLMFTVEGDHNGRHNLPGTPMLDTLTGACLLLGLGICLRRITHWFYQLLVLWFCASVLGGILSLDFEAPQAARTIGSIAPIALIAALPLALLAHYVAQGAMRGLGWWSGRTRGPTRSEGADPRQRSIALLIAALVVAAPLCLTYAHNTHQYFVQQATDLAAWSEMEGQQSVMGREALALAQQGYTVRVAPSIAGDPAFTYTSGNIDVPPFDTGVPVQLPVPPGGLALLIPNTAADVLDFVHRSYPTAPIIPLTPDYDHTLVQAEAVLVRPDDTTANLGVTVRFGTAGVAQEHVMSPIAWPAGSGLHSEAVISATMLVTGAHAWQPLAFKVAGARQATLTLDGQRFAAAERGTQPLRLGAGNHRLVVEAHGQAGAALEVQSKVASGTAPGTTWSALPPTMLAAPTMPGGGLLGLYFIGTSIGAAPDLARVDQTVDTYYQTPPVGDNFPFAARWLGTLSIARSGAYSFRLESVGPSSLLIDAHPVVQSSGDPMIASLSLAAGTHTIQIDYSATGSYLHCYLTWAPPGQSFAAIPPTVLEPAHG